MDAKVEAEYNDILAQIVIRKGTLVSPNQSDHIYGWIADDWLHLNICTVASYGVPFESRWDEFAGTFAEEDYHKTGIDLPDVTCQCGLIKGRVIRLSIYVQEMAEAVFMEMQRRLEQTVSNPKPSTVPEEYMSDGPWRVANGS